MSFLSGAREEFSQEVELRCCCNRLLARRERHTLVLRCPRCKAYAVIDFGGAGAARDVEVTFSKRPP
jgi:hypothetical protein